MIFMKLSIFKRHSLIIKSIINPEKVNKKDGLLPSGEERSKFNPDEVIIAVIKLRPS
jgi:hypothetical protein